MRTVVHDLGMWGSYAWMSAYRSVPWPVISRARDAAVRPGPPPRALMSVARHLVRAADVAAAAFPAPGRCRVLRAVYIVYYLVTIPRIPSSPPA